MFLSRRYRPNLWPFYGLIGLESGLTVGALVMVGIAAPNTYRTKLWQEGADHCWNSSPTTGLYAAANYRPYTTPKVWTQFITDYNIVIVVLSMFIALVKGTMYILHVFPPILSVLVHALLVALYTVSVYYQASSDNSDLDCPSNGPVWYISKSCSVVSRSNLLGYCRQAKATFALTCALLGLFAIYFFIGIWSCIPSKQQKLEYHDRKRAREDKWAKLEAEHEQAKREGRIEGMSPQTPGLQTGMNPMTPRTTAFNTLGGTKDLPLRNHFSSPNTPTSLNKLSFRKSGVGSPLGASFAERMGEDDEGEASSSVTGGGVRGSQQPQMFFPPPPKTSNKK